MGNTATKGMITKGSKLKDGMTYRKMGPFGNEPGQWRTAERVLPAVRAGYRVVWLADGNTDSVLTSSVIEILA